MTTTEEFNGWPNRETWAFNLHWANDYALYHAVIAYARHQRERTDITIGRNVKDGLRIAYTDILEEGHVNENDPMGAYLFNVSPGVLRRMGHEVGSFWRVSEVSVGETVREALGNED